MADVEVRSVPEADALEFARVCELAFGTVATDEEAEAVASVVFHPEWAIGAYDGNRLVATASAIPLELTLPAGPGKPVPMVATVGATAVGVLPTHRRRGLLNQMMAYQLAQVHQRGLALAVLTASESVIYGRYGYGIAASCHSLSIDTKRAAFLSIVDGHRARRGRLRLIDASEAAERLPEVHERARRLRPGDVTRTKAGWARMLSDPERDRRGGTARMYVVHESADGALDGYASYRKHFQWDRNLHTNRVSVEDLYSTSPQVHAALWRFLLDLDLVAEVTAPLRPVDDPLRWMLEDPRHLRSGLGDFLWARLVDIPAALSARGYGAETDLVLHVDGPTTGRYFLSTAAGAGSCRPAKDSEPTDLVLGLSELGAIYLGGCPPSLLAAAGRLDEARPGALARADAAFGSPLAPFCGTHF